MTGKSENMADDEIERQDLDDNPEWDEANTASLDPAARLAFARVHLELTQREFAFLLNVPLATLRNWEQRRTEPDPVARTLIDLIFADPSGMRERLVSRNTAA